MKRQKKIKLICYDCGKTFYKYYKKEYCDNCSGIYHNLSKHIRDMILMRDNHTCQKCGKTDKEIGGKRPLVVHHIKEWRYSLDDSLKNLVTLCGKCHRLVHGKKKKERLIDTMTVKHKKRINPVWKGRFSGFY